VSALAGADDVVLAAVFTKASDPIPADERLAPETIVAGLEGGGRAGPHDRRRARDPDHVVTTARPGDVIVVMSNGAFGGLPALVVEALGAR